MEAVKREFKQVPARKIHRSNVLPSRDSYDRSFADSVREDGVQQPLIVRPDPKNPDEYEIIDGYGRLSFSKPEDVVTVEVRQVPKDSDVFKVSNMTFLRKGLSTYERARRLTSWINTLARESNAQGAQARVAKDARISESLISQYVTIDRMFRKLETLPERRTVNFDALKIQGVNRLYELARLTEHPSSLLKVSQQLSNEPQMRLEELKKRVDAALEEASPEEEDILADLTEDPEVIERQRKKRQDETVELTQEMVKLADETRQDLTIFETRIKLLDAKLLNAEVLNVLPRLQRRFKRLQKEIAKLDGYILQSVPK